MLHYLKGQHANFFPFQGQNYVVHSFFMKCQPGKSANYFMSHKAIGQRLHFCHLRGGNYVVLPVSNLELVRKFVVGAGQLGKSINQGNNSRKTLHGNAIVDINARNGVSAQHILKHSLTKNYANYLWSFRFCQLPVSNGKK